MRPEKLTFPGHSGLPLAARMDRPEGPTLATAIFAHCFTCGKDIAAARRISQRLAAMGIAVLRFDFTGLGHSKGEFQNTSFTTNVQDIQAAAAHLAEIGQAPSLLIGHSFGGAAVLKAAIGIPSIKALVTLAAPADPGHVVHNFAHAKEDLAEKGLAEVRLGNRPFLISQDFVDDVGSTDLTEAISKLNAALLVLHAPLDDTVSIDNAAQIFQAAKHPKSFVTLDDADHLITAPSDAEYAADVISAWVSRYVDLAPPPPPPGAPEGIVRVSEADPDGFLQDVQNGPWHHILADEPRAYGGTNRGLSPYGFLAAGLGACTSMTVRMYARRKGWPLSGIHVEVNHDKVHAQDAEQRGDIKIDRFIRVIHLEGDLTQDQRARLLEIADKCPVHQTLEGNSEVLTELAD
ncbi:bifunctional alpha/beta hydrolase/OsmC family protein [Actibacterium pelagium]|uniref:Osmotically inducible protein C n=1 Tax=Actibacterium pelagium TaxID=2029103 RepID=A0A917AC30_9RHOB|nr:bifunctional alpha/beta hydrolase/OsmC family protein [Actibacterium pelagium]GGE40341.1 osmotically inducible protein C [Actibacterium pelagium]